MNNYLITMLKNGATDCMFNIGYEKEIELIFDKAYNAVVMKGTFKARNRYQAIQQAHEKRRWLIRNKEWGI